MAVCMTGSSDENPMYSAVSIFHFKPVTPRGVFFTLSHDMKIIILTAFLGGIAWRCLVFRSFPVDRVALRRGKTTGRTGPRRNKPANNASASTTDTSAGSSNATTTSEVAPSDNASVSHSVSSGNDA